MSNVPPIREVRSGRSRLPSCDHHWFAPQVFGGGSFANWFRAMVHRNTGTTAPPPWRVEPSENGVHFFGTLCTREATSIVAAVREATRGAKSAVLDFDGVEQIDGGVVALLHADLAERGVHARLRCSDPLRVLFELYGEGVPPPQRARMPHAVAARFGRVALQEVADLERVLGFIGESLVSLGRLVRQPRLAQWKEVPLLVERAGVDALLVVLVLNFLIGFVMAYMSAHALEVFGANIYVAELVGLAITRQLGPMMTAIIVCGRSGAAFASELGTMSVSEELNALRTLGLDPFGWLVLPRVIALLLVMPVLTLLADVVGILGGLVVGVTSLGLTTRSYFNETRDALVPWDVMSGLVMSVGFAVAIAFIACQQGFAASGGAEGVGRRTTATVVASLFAIVVLDTLFTVLFRSVGLL